MTGARKRAADHSARQWADIETREAAEDATFIQAATSAPTNGTRQHLIENLVPLAAYLARQEHRKLPRWIGLDEARSAAYLALVQAVDRWDASRGVPLGAWVRKPIRGAVLDLGRRKAARLAWVPEAGTFQPEGFHGSHESRDSIPDPAPSPESVLAYDEFRASVWRKVDALPPKLALVVRLRFCGGLSYDNIGRLMRRPVKGDTVESMRTEAFKMLRGEA